MGGTRFVGKPIVERLLAKNHHLTLFTRGRNPLPLNVEHIRGDRHSDEDLKALTDRSFDVIVDTSGRKLVDTQRVLSLTGAPKYRFLYLSSAGIYSDSIYFPLGEDSQIDPHSRHSGKAETEKWLLDSGIPFTSFRPTYIYGPGNYNPIERWFFDRIAYSRPIPMPADGSTITQLGHVDDLAEAMVKSLDFDITNNIAYNCSGKKGVTLLGLIHTAAKACGKDIEMLDIRSFDPLKLDPKARKAYPLRIVNFVTDISRLQKDISWQPSFSLEDGLVDSYQNDYLSHPKTDVDFSKDLELIGA